MTVKSVPTTILFSFFVLGSISAQDFNKEFNELTSKNDTAGIRILLKSWELKSPDDPELYTAYFNYYYLVSKKDMLEIGNYPKPGEPSLEINSLDTSQKNPVAFIYDGTQYNRTYLAKAFDYIDRGIKKYPDRLDMRFGKVYLLGKAGDYEGFSNEIIRAVDRSSNNNNKWLWTDNKPLEDPGAVYA